MIDIVDPRGKKVEIEANSVEMKWPSGFVGQRVGSFGNGKSNVEGFLQQMGRICVE